MSADPSNQDQTEATGAYQPPDQTEPTQALPIADQTEATGAYQPPDQTEPTEAAAEPDQTEATGAYNPQAAMPDATVLHAVDQSGALDVSSATTDFQPQSQAASAAADVSGATTDFAPQGRPTSPGFVDGVRRHEPGRPAGGETQAFLQPPAEVAGQPGGTPEAADAGQVMGHYVLKKFHARGGMGEIWFAEDSDIGRDVALKRMRPGHDHHKTRFLLEAQITGQLEHPGVVPVHELGRNDDGQPYYVMKFVHGDTLEKAIKNYHAGTQTPGVTREVRFHQLLDSFVNLCQTIAYAHSRGVIHRDIKPDNVMLGPFGETVVLDWGIAKVMGMPEAPDGFGSTPVRYTGETELTRAGTVQGTPSYMAPEVAEGKTAEIDQKSDIYLLGSTLYQLLTGKRPRKAANLAEVLKMARKTPPPAPRKIDANIPPALDAICQKAMAHTKAQRYETASALAEEMQRYLAGEPVLAYREPWLARAWRWAKKHQKALRAAAVLTLLVVVSVSAFAVVRRATQETAFLKSQSQARGDLQEFRRKSDEAHFYLASVKPEAGNAPHFDAQKGKDAADAALRLIEPWGPTLEKLPLTEEEKAAGAKQLSDLLLLFVQTRSQESPAPAEAQELLGMLERAAALQPPSRAYHQIRARLLGEDAKGSRSPKEAGNEDMPMTALDHFLQGEQYRTEAESQSELKEQVDDPLPNRELLLKAVDEFRQAVHLDPKHYWAHFRLAYCYMSLKQSADSVEALAACMALRPDSPWSSDARALALASLNRFDEAERDMEKAQQLGLELRQIRLDRGVMYQGQNKKDLALAEFAAVLAEPDEQRLLKAVLDRGKLYVKGDQPEKAIQDLSEFIAARPRYLPAHLLRARAHFALDQDAQGIDDLNAYISKGQPFDKESSSAYALRGRRLRLMILDLPEKVQNRKRLLAANQLQKAVQLGARSAIVYNDFGAVLETLAKFREALAVYNAGLKLFPRDAPLLVKRGWVYEKLKQYDKAREDFAAAIRSDPKHAEAHSGLGYIQAITRAQADALREANLAVLHGSEDYLVLHNVACIYGEIAEIDANRAEEYEDLALGQLKRAVELYKRETSGPDESILIQGESAFHESLRARPEFKKLLPPASPNKAN